MSRCHGRINAVVSTLLIAYIVLSVCSCPLLIEARIQNFSAIQGSLVHQSKKEGLDHQRRMREAPKQHFSPVPNLAVHHDLARPSFDSTIRNRKNR
ncbi:hypothetical protein AB3S75_009515 [Citrus x aurantiifolia]